MSDTQSIIVYRNPLEQAMWESVMSGGGQFVPIFTGGVVFLAAVIAMSNIFDGIYGWNKPKWTVPVSFCVGIAAWVLATYWMWQ